MDLSNNTKRVRRGLTFSKDFEDINPRRDFMKGERMDVHWIEEDDKTIVVLEDGKRWSKSHFHEFAINGEFFKRGLRLKVGASDDTIPLSTGRYWDTLWIEKDATNVFVDDYGAYPKSLFENFDDIGVYHERGLTFSQNVSTTMGTFFKKGEKWDVNWYDTGGNNIKTEEAVLIHKDIFEEFNPSCLMEDDIVVSVVRKLQEETIQNQDDKNTEKKTGFWHSLWKYFASDSWLVFVLLVAFISSSSEHKHKEELLKDALILSEHMGDVTEKTAKSEREALKWVYSKGGIPESEKEPYRKVIRWGRKEVARHEKKTDELYQKAILYHEWINVMEWVQAVCGLFIWYSSIYWVVLSVKKIRMLRKNLKKIRDEKDTFA